MYFRSKTVLLYMLPVILIACAVSAVLLGSARSSVSTAQNPNQTRPGKGRNLSLQPEAFKLSRRLGNRFASARQTSSILAGTLVTGALQQDVSVVRKQTSSGEEVGIGVAGAPGTLTWSDGDGPGTAGANVNEGQRVLVERLVLDSPDQFVLAQLRGASYYTVARNVRDDVGGSDDYSGPLWDVIRIEEPDRGPSRRPLSNSRLYYINVQTGLIDKIVSEVRGEKIEANVVQWVEQGGEKIPARMVWKRGDETVQEFRLTSFTVQPQP